jgi:hypothetical protein
MYTSLACLFLLATIHQESGEKVPVLSPMIIAHQGFSISASSVILDIYMHKEGNNERNYER